jgi:hypothetical protein
MPYIHKDIKMGRQDTNKQSGWQLIVPVGCQLHCGCEYRLHVIRESQLLTLSEAILIVYVLIMVRVISRTQHY